MTIIAQAAKAAEILESVAEDIRTYGHYQDRLGQKLYESYGFAPGEELKPEPHVQVCVLENPTGARIFASGSDWEEQARQLANRAVGRVVADEDEVEAYEDPTFVVGDWSDATLTPEVLETLHRTARILRGETVWTYMIRRLTDLYWKHHAA